jgi:hypothetical protein
MDAQQFATAIAILYGKFGPSVVLARADLFSRIYSFSDTLQLPHLAIPASRLV